VTLIIGVRCHDGIVVAADSAVSTGPTALPLGRKLTLHTSDPLIVGVAGSVPFGQRLCGALHDHMKSFRTGPVARSLTKLREAIKPLVEDEWKLAEQQAKAQNNSQIVLQQAGFQLVVAYPLDSTPCLVSVAHSCQPMFIGPDPLTFTTAGSGQHLAEPFMYFVRRVLWKNKTPSLADGTLGALWAMRHAIQTNPGGIGGDVQIMQLTVSGKDVVGHELEPSEFQEHDQCLGELEDHIQTWARKIDPTTTAETPIPPPP